MTGLIAMRPPAAGDRINNYLLDERIGAGSFGEVWKAHHHVFPETVAIKIPTDPQYVRNLRREGVAIHGLRHPNIVRAIDLDPYGDPPYLIMEYVDGPSLRPLIDACPQGLPLPAVLAITRGVLGALDAAHAANLIHRDIKPENILVAGGDGIDRMVPERVKVTDFGLGAAGGLTTASILQSGSLQTADGRSLAGTLAYMSPEQREGGTVDARSDLYSFGIVLFEMLTGRRPAGNDLPGRYRADLPPWVDPFFQKFYARHEWRFASARDALRAIPPDIPPAVPTDPAAGASRRIRGPQGWRCGVCRGPVRPDDQFCVHCGGQLVDRVPRCPACEAYVHRDDRYCILCGTALPTLFG